MVSLLSLYQPRKPIFHKTAISISVGVLCLLIVIIILYFIYYFSSPRYDFQCIDTNYNNVQDHFITSTCNTKDLIDKYPEPIYINASYYANPQYVMNNTDFFYNQSYTLDLQFETIPITRKLLDINSLANNTQTYKTFNTLILNQTSFMFNIYYSQYVQLYVKRQNKTSVGPWPGALYYTCRFNLCAASHIIAFSINKISPFENRYFTVSNNTVRTTTTRTESNKAYYDFPFTYIDINLYNNMTVNCCGSTLRSGINHIPIILSGIGGIISFVLLFGNQTYILIEKGKQYIDKKYYNITYATEDNNLSVRI